MKIRNLAALVLSALLANTSYAAENAADDVKAWVETNVPKMMRDAKMPGYAIAVVQNGDMIYAEGFGARDPTQGLPATPNTLFGIGSITKSFVAISILQLVERSIFFTTTPPGEC